MINEKFKVIVFIQFTTSVMSLCISLYRFTRNVTNAIFLEVLLFSLCTIIQIFYYCWFANEAKLKSLELPQKILHSNWTSLQIDTKKILLMIMRRATVPIEITSGVMVKMDIESLKVILKTSYSAFNMLRQNQ
nr:odorant receptor 45a-like [Nomia melanderi]